MTRPRLMVFGPPELVVDSRPVTFRTRKALALLVYLLLEPGRPSREALTALLWPDSDRERARGALRRTLVLLREDLGPAASALLATRETLALDAAALDTDLSPVRAAADAPADDTSLPLLRAGVLAYRGEFLAGFSLADAPEFDTWAATQREHWHQRLAAIFDRLSAGELTQGSNATATAARWIAHDPLDENAHRRLMNVHAAAGDRAAALRAFEQCRATLERELGVRPDPETETLAARLRTGVLQPVAASDSRPALPPSPPRPAATQHPRTAPPPTPAAPLVGREAELAALAETFAQAAAGSTRAIVLVGEAGIGKTSLADAFARSLDGQATVLRGRALELGGRLPYQPLAQALQGFFATEHAPGALLDAPRLAALGRLVPDLAARLPDLPAPAGDDALAQGRLFEAVTRLLAVLADRSPVLLLLDDLQWADTATGDLLAAALRDWAGHATPLLALITLRSEDQAAVVPWLAALGRDLPLTYLPVPPLAPAAAAALVARLGGVPTAEEEQRLVAQTRGHPLLLVETLRSLQPGHTAPGIAPAVRGLVRERVSRLSPAAHELLLAAAVLGPADEAPLWMVAALDEAAGVAALEEGLGRRLLEPNGAQYQLSHDLVRDVLLAEASPPRLRLLHRRALDALRDAAPPAVLALHAEGGGRPADVARYSLEAGEAALAVGAPREAAGHFARALALCDAPGVALGAEGEERLFRGLGRAQQLGNDWGAAEATYAAMAARGAEREQPGLRIAALNELAVLVAQQHFDIARGMALLDEAAALAALAQPEREPETLWNQAQVAVVSWRPEAANLARRALALAEERGQRELAARSRYVLSQAHSYAGAWEEAASEAATARAAFTALRSRALRQQPAGATHVWSGAAGAAAQQLQALEASCLWQLAQAEIHLGAPAPALGHARAAFDLAGALANPWVQVAAAINITHALVALDRLDEAWQVAADGVARAAALPNPAVQFWMQLAEAAALLAAGRHDEALGALQRNDARIAALGPGVAARVVVGTYRCAALLARGERASAAGLAVELAALRRALPNPRLFWDFVQHAEVAALAQAGQLDLAREHSATIAVAAGANQRFQLISWRAEAALAQVAGDAAAERRALTEAQRIAAMLGLAGELRQLRDQGHPLHAAAG